VAHWVRLAKQNKMSELICHNPNSIEVFEFPNQAFVYDNLSNGVLHSLTGLQTNVSNGAHFNFIVSNGDRSKQRDKDFPTNSTNMIPEGAKIRSVDIYYYEGSLSYITGFEFFDGERRSIFKVGMIG
jgi:hypothetical protein